LASRGGGDHLAQLGDQLLEFLAAEPDGVLPEADEVTGGVGVFPGRRRGPIARLFSGPRRFDRLCGGRLRCVMVG
jgi:hypothetical protein